MSQLMLTRTKTTVTEPIPTVRLLAGLHNENLLRRLLAATRHLVILSPPDEGDEGLVALARTLRNPETTTGFARVAASSWLKGLDLESPVAKNGTTCLVAYALAYAGEGMEDVSAYGDWLRETEGRCISAWVHKFFGMTIAY